MDAILMSVRVNEENDPVEEWNKHNAEILGHSKMLNDYNFKALHFTNELGTDLTVELVKIISGAAAVSIPQRVCIQPEYAD